MYLQGVYNVRRKWAAPFPSSAGSPLSDPQANKLISPSARDNFQNLNSLLLVTGARNQLWHRDSLDRMHQWVTQGSPGRSRSIKKLVFPEYGHQDLLWGAAAVRDVFDDLLKDGLGGRAVSLGVGNEEDDDDPPTHRSF